MDWTQFKQTLCDDLRPNALDAMNPYVTINAVMPMVEYQSAEIERLKAELELRDKVIEQATEQMVANDEGDIFIRSISKEIFVGCTEDCPDLFAHLSGRGE